MWYSQFLNTQNYILFKTSAWGLFLKCSQNFANFSLDILIKYILIEEKECSGLILKYPSSKLKKTLGDSAFLSAPPNL